MTQQDNGLRSDSSRDMFILAQILTLVKQMHGKICANPPEAQQSKKLFGAAMLGELGRTLLRVLVPYLTPYILAALTGFGAMIVMMWKAFTRSWLGS